MKSLNSISITNATLHEPLFLGSTVGQVGPVFGQHGLKSEAKSVKMTFQDGMLIMEFSNKVTILVPATNAKFMTTNEILTEAAVKK